MPFGIMAQFKTIYYSFLSSSTKCTAPNITWPKLLSFYNRLASDVSPQCYSSSQSCLLLTLFFSLLLIFSLWYGVVIIQPFVCVCVCVCVFLGHWNSLKKLRRFLTYLTSHQLHILLITHAVFSSRNNLHTC